MFAPQQNTADSATIAATFLDSAAALEGALHEAELRTQQLEDRLRREQLALADQRRSAFSREAEIRAWLVAIRAAIADLGRGPTTVLPSFTDLPFRRS